jgi:hypothetical protein
LQNKQTSLNRATNQMLRYIKQHSIFHDTCLVIAEKILLILHLLKRNYVCFIANFLS